MEPLEQVVVATGIVVAVQFWMWLYLIRRTGKRLLALEERVFGHPNKAGNRPAARNT